jgi:hypothetical protein
MEGMLRDVLSARGWSTRSRKAPFRKFRQIGAVRFCNLAEASFKKSHIFRAKRGIHMTFCLAAI